MISTLAPLILSGYLTFWTRSNGTELPRPSAPSRKITGVINPPTSSGASTRFKEHFKGKDLEGDFQMFYINPKDSKPYVVTQIDLYDSETHEPVGQCSSYHSIEDSVPLPVGSCSVFVKKEGVFFQTGVTFSRVSYLSP